MNGVVLDGGCEGNVGNYSDHDHSSMGKTNKGAESETKTTFTKKKSGNAIRVCQNGELELTDVTAKNMYTNAEMGCFLQVGEKGKQDDTYKAKVSLKNVKVTNCLSDSDYGIIHASGTYAKSAITMENCEVGYCMVKKGGTGTGYGGVLKGDGNTTCVLEMKKCTMHNCWSSGWGGAILWAAGKGGSKATLENCDFYYNYARYLGGAISNEGVMELDGCEISYNVAGFGGGGIAAFPFTLTGESYEGMENAVGLKLVENNKVTSNRTLYITNKGGQNVDPDAKVSKDDDKTLEEDDYGFNPYYTHNMAEVDKCYPSGGGGLWVLMNKDGWQCDLSIDRSNEIADNFSAYNGGGVFLYKKAPSGKTDYSDGGNTEMSIGAVIKNNEAGCSGGGAAVGADKTVANYPNVTVTGGEITSNVASNGNGGGIYMPGGIFEIKGGKIALNKALAEKGSASSSEAGNGGGIAIAEGEFKVTAADFEISGNEAERYGGGLYVFNATKDVNFSGGTFRENTALAGGGVSLEGSGSENRVTLSMSADVEYNKAENGGGIYLNNYADLVVKGGLLRNNEAGDSSTGKLAEKTASKKSVTEVKGVGGGVFLDSNTSLSFDVSDNQLGLYGNQAVNAADDIFASGNNTKITLPDVEGMNLTGFSVPAGTLFWAEDYYSNYDNGTYEKDENYECLNDNKPDFDNPEHNLRYRFALQNLKRSHIVEVEGETFENRYVCLTLGYQIFYVTIKKTGLAKGENAIFEISSDKANVAKPYISMLLTGKEEGGEISKRVALPEGKWKVTEKTAWGWTYEPEGNIEIEKDVDDDGIEFAFINEKKETERLYDEAIKVNEMGITSAKEP